MHYENELIMVFIFLCYYYRYTCQLNYQWPKPETRHTVRIRHLVDHLHLHRRQFQIHVIHPGTANLSRKKLKQELASKFNVSNTQTIFISSFKTKGPFSKGFGVIYDSIDDALQHEPKHRLVRNGMKANAENPIHESKNRENKFCNIKTPKTN